MELRKRRPLARGIDYSIFKFTTFVNSRFGKSHVPTAGFLCPFESDVISGARPFSADMQTYEIGRLPVEADMSVLR
jgi:hypothetical protein